MNRLKKISLPLLLLSTFPILSHADDQPPTVEDHPHHWKTVGVFGASFSGRTKYTINQFGGSTVGTTSDQANPFANFAGELTYQSGFPLGLSFLLEGTRYEYKTGGSDGELGVYAMPRLAHTFGGVEIWAGVGLGFMTNNLGGPSSETVDGVTLTLTDMTPVSFAWSPRVGVDVDLPNRLFLGFQVSYISTKFSVPYATFDVNPTTGTVDCTRSWVSAALRFGARL